ncbi:hypothetical protein WH240_08000 [Gluconobacter wancherniae]|nr:hypothetical protein NBRC103581_00638 [Gluconobacter wancherniae NBRC 103581]
MINPLAAFPVLCALLFPVNAFAQSSHDWLPESGVKSPYSPLAVPTTLRPLKVSLSILLKTGFRITTTTSYAESGALFTLEKHGQTILCVLTPPNPQTDQNVPTSRCWSL